jgi:hypothetical protein
MTPPTIEIFIVMNENGEYVMSDVDGETALQQFEDEGLGEDSGCFPRIVKLNVTMTTPVVTEDEPPPVVTEVNVTVPDE